VLRKVLYYVNEEFLDCFREFVAVEIELLNTLKPEKLKKIFKPVDDVLLN
jgi:hypothetical protein